MEKVEPLNSFLVLEKELRETLWLLPLCVLLPKADEKYDRWKEKMERIEVMEGRCWRDKMMEQL